jgi:hypothetical protein
MRVACLLSLIPLAFTEGCAGLIATSGIDLDAFETSNEVHAKFGEPRATGSAKGTFKEGQPVPESAAFYEDYRTRQKISDRLWCDGDGYAISLVATAGTIEFLLLPQQLYYFTKHKITGQTLRMIYDANGKVVAGQLDGKNLFLHPHSLTTHEAASPSPPAISLPPLPGPP